MIAITLIFQQKNEASASEKVIASYSTVQLSANVISEKLLQQTDCLNAKYHQYFMINIISSYLKISLDFNGK